MLLKMDYSYYEYLKGKNVFGNKVGWFDLLCMILIIFFFKKKYVFDKK